MMGVFQPLAWMPSKMAGTAAAAASGLTVMRTSSEPERAKAAICWTVDSTSAVSVLVMDWTTTGASGPTVTEPIFTETAGRRRISGIDSPSPSLPVQVSGADAGGDPATDYFCP